VLAEFAMECALHAKPDAKPDFCFTRRGRKETKAGRIYGHETQRADGATRAYDSYETYS
jgi:hypothetical protein